jgi:hypothetical protein
MPHHLHAHVARRADRPQGECFIDRLHTCFIFQYSLLRSGWNRIGKHVHMVDLIILMNVDIYADARLLALLVMRIVFAACSYTSSSCSSDPKILELLLQVRIWEYTCLLNTDLIHTEILVCRGIYV